MDESFDMRQAGVFAVGGLMARGVAFFELRRKWEKLCKRSDLNIAYFKASECERGSGEFAKFVATPRKPTPEEKQTLDAISHEFVTLIPKEEFLIVHGIGVVQSDFYDVVRDRKARAILGDTPYRLTYDLAMIQCAWTMKELERRRLEDLKPWQKWQKVNRDHVAFVCDESQQHSPIAHEAYRNLKENNPNASEYMATYSVGDEKHCAALQAADAAVFEIRRALNLVFRQWPGHLRKQFGILADAKKVFLIQHTERKHLEHIVSTHKLGQPFKLDEIMEQVFYKNVKFNV